jgi:acyl carrier protein
MTIAIGETTLATVIALVNDLTQDWGLETDAPPGASTRLAADLKFASVDIIQLCVALEECYERRFGFQDLLMRDGSYVGDLTLGQLSDFIDTQLTHKEPLS